MTIVEYWNIIDVICFGSSQKNQVKLDPFKLWIFDVNDIDTVGVVYVRDIFKRWMVCWKRRLYFHFVSEAQNALPTSVASVGKAFIGTNELPSS